MKLMWRPLHGSYPRRYLARRLEHGSRSTGDNEGYSRGPVRPFSSSLLFAEFIEDRANAFAAFSLTFMHARGSGIFAS
jgi:hypothetical protein